MKINRYLHDYSISRETLAKVAAKNYRNGAINPKAFRRKLFPKKISFRRESSITR